MIVFVSKKYVVVGGATQALEDGKVHDCDDNRDWDEKLRTHMIQEGAVAVLDPAVFALGFGPKQSPVSAATRLDALGSSWLAQQARG